jgi:hypothetical protein
MNGIYFAETETSFLGELPGLKMDYVYYGKTYIPGT